MATPTRREQPSAAERRAARAAERAERKQQRSERGQTKRSLPDVKGGLEGLRARVLERPVPYVVAGIILAVLLLLYAPARSYYVALRTNEDLQRYYDAYAEQNEELTSDIMRLHSQEGIEDEAHKRGWGYEDETNVTVEGLEAEPTPDEPKDVVIADERPWYQVILDVLFMYEPGHWQ